MAWHDVKATAALIGVSAGTVYDLCAAGKLVHRRIGARGGRIRISDAAIEAYLKSCEVGPENCPARKAEAARRPLPTKAVKGRGRPDGKPVRSLWRD